MRRVAERLRFYLTNREERRKRSGFTLVELLVVITIIGILIGLLMPAVQAARESGRRAQCKNNVKQLALACNLHLERTGFFPTGGWGFGWAGDPDRGFTNKQPGGWMYNILPFIDQANLHEKGAGGDRMAGRKRAETAVAGFYCPSRRRAASYPYTRSGEYVNIDSPSPTIGRSDYAANGGDSAFISNSPGSGECGWPGPATLQQGDAMSDSDWESHRGTYEVSTGVIYRRSMIKPAHITDGMSSTYLLGEKYLTNTYYITGEGFGSNQGWDVGYDYDTVRWANPPGGLSNECTPQQDRALVPGDDASNASRIAKSIYAFGSAHSSGFHMALCDGSVRSISFAIDVNVHANLSNRSDGEALDAATY